MLTSVDSAGRQNKIVLVALVFERSFHSHDVHGRRQLRLLSFLEAPLAFRVTIALLDGAPAAWPTRPAASAAAGVHVLQFDFSATARCSGLVLDMVSVEWGFINS